MTVTNDLIARIGAATERYGPFASTHEALGVASEEWDELREAITSLVALGEAGSKASVQIVASLGAINEKGLPHIKALKPEKFAECLALVKAKIEELTPKGVL